MDWSILARWEWLVIEFAVLALAIFELVSVRRSLRRDREAKAARESRAVQTVAVESTERRSVTLEPAEGA